MPVLEELGDVPKNDWNIKPDPETLAYHSRQTEPYRSTVHFAEFIKPWMEKSKRIIDCGSGAGQATAYLAETYQHCSFIGLEISQRLLAMALKIETPNLGFLQMDITRMLEPTNKVDGVVSLATLSWMPDYKEPLDEIVRKIKPTWIAVSSLFYPGEISCRIEVSETKRPRSSYYNVYSIPEVVRFMAERGYQAVYKPFEIDVELKKPSNPDIMKSWTEHGRIFSGPLYLPWGFLGFER